MDATQGFSFSSDYLNGLGSGKDPSDDGGGGGPPNQKSFRDLVVSQRQLLSPHPNVDLIQQKLARIKYEGGNPMKPMVFIDDSIYEGLCAPWEDTLPIKLLGKTVGYHFLKEKLVRLWKLSSYFDIFDIGNGYYMLKFSDEDDKKKVMEEGTWTIFNHYLMVCTWSQDFISPDAKIDKTKGREENKNKLTREQGKGTFEQTLPFLSLDAAVLAFAYHPDYYHHAFPSFV